MTAPPSPGLDSPPQLGGVTAVLGPTNTGKTHLAIERMLAHQTGVIGLPLRLLAREVYARVVQRVGDDKVALITGEEKIVPKDARYRVCTVEALPSDTDASFLAIDEIQLAADLERGHIFTDRILNLRGRDETLLLGAATMRNVIGKLVPGVNVVTRPRLSTLSYSGSKKITRLPQRSAAVAFSADEVYAIGELIRRQRGGVAVVLGALSPRTRNAQVELYQSGDVDFLVATDAIGMGLNLDLDHVAFAADRKFDGYQYRRLTPAEFGQVAGRAGRHTHNGTFGVTGRVDPLEDELVDALESHRFETIKTVQWRNAELDFDSLLSLRDSLELPPDRDGLVRAPPAEDLRVLETAIRDPAIAALADRRESVELLWDVCQLPDYRRIAPANHAELVLTVFGQLVRHGAIDEGWFGDQIAHADRADGDIDTLSNRIAHIRTWNYAANRSNWLADQKHWQERTRAIEDRLSDALHERLIQRFVDRRTSVLMRRLRENAMLEAEITDTGDVIVEGQHVGELQGFRFVPDPDAEGPDAKAIRSAAQKALASEITRRAEAMSNAGNDQFVLAADGTVRWQGTAVARLAKGNDDTLLPRILLLADEGVAGPDREAVAARLELWLDQHCKTLLKPLFDLRSAEDLAAEARGLAFRLAEDLGVIERKAIAEDVRNLEQDSRAGMRQLGVRFGAYHIYVPTLLKPGPSALLAVLWGLRNDSLDVPGVAELPSLSAAGRTTIPFDPSIPKPLYRVVGYRVSGERAVRIDILERLADLIRPLIAWRPNEQQPEPPEGAMPPGGFSVTPQMTSLLGASGEDVGSVLRSLGYRSDRRVVERPPLVAEGSGTDRPEPISPALIDEPIGAGETADNVVKQAEELDAVLAALVGVEEPAMPGAEQVASPESLVAHAVVPVSDDHEHAAAQPKVSDETTAPPDDPFIGGEESDEPAFVEVWRAARVGNRNSGPRSKRADARGKDEAGAGERNRRAAKPRSKASGGKRGGKSTDRAAGVKHASSPKAVAVDPDSPFAVLAALKADLGDRKK